MTITRFSTGLRKDDMLAGNTSFAASDMELISTIRVGSGKAANVTFSNIPQEYKHLQIRGIGQTDRAATLSNIYLRFNGDSATNYAWHRIEGSGSAASSDAAASATGYQVSFGMPGSSIGGSYFAGGIVDVLDYSNASKYKTARSLAGTDSNDTNGRIRLTSGLWMSTAAVTSLVLVPDTANNFVQYSKFSLYGIRG